MRTIPRSGLVLRQQAGDSSKVARQTLNRRRAFISASRKYESGDELPKLVNKHARLTQQVDVDTKAFSNRTPTGALERYSMEAFTEQSRLVWRIISATKKCLRIAS